MDKNMDKNMEYIADTQTLIGTQKKHLVDMETGEDIFVDQITKRIYGQQNFWKCYLMDFLAVLGIFDSRQVDVFIYIVQNTDPSKNMFVGTYREIANELKCSLDTVTRIMKKLQANNFITKKQNGVYLVNPNILMKGNDHKRQILLNYYESTQPINQITMQRGRQKPIEARQEGIQGQYAFSDTSMELHEELPSYTESEAENEED